MLTNPDAGTRRNASALRNHMIKTMWEILKTTHDIQYTHKKTRTKFGSVYSARLFIVRDDANTERVWVSNGAIMLGPICLTAPLLDGLKRRDPGPVFQQATGIGEKDLRDVTLTDTLTFDESRVHLFGGKRHGIDSVYLELGLQWLDVGEGRNRKRTQDPKGLTVRQGDERDPLVLSSAHTGRVAIICPTRLSP